MSRARRPESRQNAVRSRKRVRAWEGLMLRGIGICLAAGACAALWMVGSAASGAETGPSFDCAKATQPDEKAICADPQLAAMDRLIAKAYKDFEPAFGGDKKAIARSL